MPTTPNTVKTLHQVLVPHKMLPTKSSRYFEQDDCVSQSACLSANSKRAYQRTSLASIAPSSTSKHNTRAVSRRPLSRSLSLIDSFRRWQITGSADSNFPRVPRYLGRHGASPKPSAQAEIVNRLSGKDLRAWGFQKSQRLLHFCPMGSLLCLDFIPIHVLVLAMMVSICRQYGLTHRIHRGTDTIRSRLGHSRFTMIGVFKT